MKTNKYENKIERETELNVVPVSLEKEFEAYQMAEEINFDHRWQLVDEEQKLIESEQYQKVQKLKFMVEQQERTKLHQLAIMEAYMIENNIKEIEVGEVKLKLKCNRSSQVAITNTETVPQQYTRVKVEVDKRKALSDLRDGIYIEGLELQDTESYKIEVVYPALVIGGKK
ncbi:MAG: siphovirus Gp157 family protein [Fusobacteriaceae bacterium]